MRGPDTPPPLHPSWAIQISEINVTPRTPKLIVNWFPYSNGIFFWSMHAYGMLILNGKFLRLEVKHTNIKSATA